MRPPAGVDHHIGDLMELREFFSPDAVKLELEGSTKDEVLKELIGLLKLDEKSEGMLFKMLKRRENLGSTGIGRGIAIPHCRSLVVNNQSFPVLGKIAQFSKESDVPQRLRGLDEPQQFMALLEEKGV